MILVEETAVPEEALPLAELREHLRLGSGVGAEELQEAAMRRGLRAALAAIEKRTGKALLERELSWTGSGWSDPAAQPLPVAPVSAVVSVVLIDAEGAETLAAPVLWRLEPDAQRPRLLATGAALPAVAPGGAVRLELLAGFGPEWSAVPADLAQAVLMLAAHYYDYRHEAEGATALPYSVAALIEPYRTVRLLGGAGA